MMILMEKAQPRFLLCKMLVITRKWGRKLTFSYRFSNFGDWPRVSAVHISTEYSSDLQEDGKNRQKMRFAAITGLKNQFLVRGQGQFFTRGTGAFPLFELTASQTGEMQNREIVIVLISHLRHQLMHKVIFFVQIRVPTF